MNEVIIHTVNGVNYVKLTIPIIDKTMFEKCSRLVEKYECIEIGGEYINGGFWGRSFMKYSILVPEKSIMQFQKDNI